MSYPSADQANADKIARVQWETAEVAKIMRHNVEKVMERGEALDSLETKTKSLSDSATVFKRSAERLRRMACIRNYRLTAIILLILTIGILLALWAGGAFNH